MNTQLDPMTIGPLSLADLLEDCEGEAEIAHVSPVDVRWVAEYVKALQAQVAAAGTAERRRIILLARQWGTEHTTAFADYLEQDNPADPPREYRGDRDLPREPLE